MTISLTAAANTMAVTLRDTLPRTKWRTRFAPAPTGHLPLGHVVNAIHVWGIAAAFGGEVLLRIEDHDRTRSRGDFEISLLHDLDWLGLVPDIGKTNEFRAGAHPQRQSDNLSRYQHVLQNWTAQDLAYPCICTRNEIARLAGTIAGEDLRYPGTCANARVSAFATFARRARMRDTDEAFNDLRVGTQMQRPSEQCGDVLVRDRNGNFTYQFAVVVDDFDQKIDLVIRGEDLLASTGRQHQLARRLGRAHLPLTLHHALLMRADGVKLSKSLGDTGVRELRAAGLSPADVFGRAAHHAGLIEHELPINANELRALFTA